ncbi:MAG: hypothetical protein PHD21_04165 [Flavobacteriales bacterium]|nr:hypothetical protein [Flavobacteriales bacterium]
MTSCSKSTDLEIGATNDLIGTWSGSNSDYSVKLVIKKYVKYSSADLITMNLKGPFGSSENASTNTYNYDESKKTLTADFMDGSILYVKYVNQNWVFNKNVDGVQVTIPITKNN